MALPALFFSSCFGSFFSGHFVTLIYNLDIIIFNILIAMATANITTKSACFLLQALQFAFFTNYLFFKAEKQLKEKMIKQGFLIRDCSNYAGLQAGYYRIAVKTEEENKRLVTALKNSLS